MKNQRFNRLTARQVDTRPAGVYADGLGLYLSVKPAGTRSWVFRFMLRGRAREMGFGPTHTVSLADARVLALDCRRQLLNGVDPIDARNASMAAKHTALLTFKECALAYIKTNKVGWSNEKHVAQWETTLATYVFPTMGNLSVAEVDTSEVLMAIEPIWATKSETASRVRGRIESILSWATVRGHRSGGTPRAGAGISRTFCPSGPK